MAKVTDGDGKDASDKITATVYNADGTVLADNVKTFVPQNAETIYVYYKYTDGQTTADLWYKTQAITENDITAKFDYDGELPVKVGVGAKITIPSATVASNVLESGSEECVVTVKKTALRWTATKTYRTDLCTKSRHKATTK